MKDERRDTMKKNTKFKMIALLLILIIIILLVPVGISMGKKLMSPIQLMETNPVIEINNKFHARKNIESVKGMEIKDVKIDDSKLNTKKLGTYPVIYHIGEKEKSIEVEVVDTKAPILKTQNIKLCENYEIKPELLVKNINDATKVKLSLKEEYILKKGKTVDVIIVAKDEAGNITEKKAKIKVLAADKKAPTIKELSGLSVVVDNKVDLMEGIEIKDNYDTNPKVTINDKNLNLSKPGEYKVSYTVSDLAGNKKTFKRNVRVTKEYPAYIPETNEKILYLTFDDGPSSNTKKIIDILERYNAKATFFVTGTRPEYNYLIKEAYEKGHTIALHTYSHDYATLYASKEAYFEDLYRVGNMVKKLTGEFPRFIRFPGGASNTISANYVPGLMTTLTNELIQRGFQYYDWNADSTDASGNNVPVSQIIANATAYENNNLNILFHDTDAKDTTVEALPAIIEHYQSKGYKIKGINNRSFTPHHQVNN